MKTRKKTCYNLVRDIVVWLVGFCKIWWKREKLKRCEILKVEGKQFVHTSPLFLYHSHYLLL